MAGRAPRRRRAPLPPTPNNCKERPALLRFPTLSSSFWAVSPFSSNSQRRAQFKIGAWEVLEPGAQSRALGLRSDSRPSLPGEAQPRVCTPGRPIGAKVGSKPLMSPALGVSPELDNTGCHGQVPTPPEAINSSNSPSLHKPLPSSLCCGSFTFIF